MSMILELFGEDILTYTKKQMIQKIKSLPPTIKERRSYLLKDWSRITGVKIDNRDYQEVDG